MKYKNDFLINILTPPHTLTVNYHAPTNCYQYINPYIAHKQECFILIAIENATHTYNSIRYNREWKLRTRLVTERTGISIAIPSFPLLMTTICDDQVSPNRRGILKKWVIKRDESV
jgi:hypothetical protein